MPVVVKKVRRFGGGGGGMGGGERGGSPLRPDFVEKTPACNKSCPNHQDVRAALTTIAQAEARGKSADQAFREGFYLLADKNPLPASISRCCSHPCENLCSRGRLDGAVAINELERFLGDYALEHRLPLERLGDEHHTERVAVVGSGPAGLSCAYQLARRGYAVTVFEASAEPGGMLRDGIPAHRLPRRVLDGEIDRLAGLRVTFRCHTMFGKDIELDALRQEFAAIFIGIRSDRQVRLGLPGEQAPNVFTAAEYLRAVASGAAPTGGVVVVLGGGETAIDAARTAVRLGARTTLVFPKRREDLSIAASEAEEEGVRLECQATPVALAVDQGRAVGLTCRREGTDDEFSLAADSIVVAGKAERAYAGLESLIDASGRVPVDEAGETPVPNMFLAADDRDLGLVSTALLRGRRAAEVIHARFRQLETAPPAAAPSIDPERLKLDYYPRQARVVPAGIPAAERLADPKLETTRGLDPDQVLVEARRCLSCGLCFACDTCWKYCQEQAIVRPPEKGQPYRIKLEYCTGCKKCADECPCGYIEMR